MYSQLLPVAAERTRDMRREARAASLARGARLGRRAARAAHAAPGAEGRLVLRAARP
ncbi:MAG TPA: hypothetical protein VMI33_08835 [Streptosporangiaceae bacterium]|nr:hypothetical protein [Streptosporangiaceae bacterium]